jgi:hypothetical protein
VTDDGDDRMAKAWRVAGDRLGIRVVAPHRIGSTSFPAFLPDFGGESGMVITRLTRSEQIGPAAAAEAGLYLSRLADAYSEFEPEMFKATLNDWGWYGPDESRPAWYSGAAWTN